MLYTSQVSAYHTLCYIIIIVVVVVVVGVVVVVIVIVIIIIIIIVIVIIIIIVVIIIIIIAAPSGFDNICIGKLHKLDSKIPSESSYSTTRELASLNQQTLPS